MTELEATAGAQLAMVVTLKLLLTPYRGNTAAVKALDDELERMRASLLASSASDAKLLAFNETAESLLVVVR